MFRIVNKKFALLNVAIVALLVVTGSVFFFAMQKSGDDAQAASTDLVTGFYPTGVDNGGDYLTSGKEDPHWTLIGVNNPANGKPHCQNGPFPRLATIIQHGIVGPAEGGTMNDSKSCPAPGKSLNGQYTENDVLRKGAIWRYQSTFNIDSQIVPNSVSLRVSGWGDDMFRLVVNGTYVTSWSPWHGTSQNRNYDDDVFTIPAGQNIFVNGTNTIEVQVLSVWEKNRFKISGFEVLTAYGKPKLQVQKTASATTMNVGQSYNYVLKVTNSGQYAGPTSGTITVSDTIPSVFTIGTLPAGCTRAGQVITCTTNSVIQPGGNVSFTIPITPTAPQSNVLNTAYAYGGGDPTCATAQSTACQGSVTVNVVAPELRIVKTASTSNMVVGVPATYTLTVSNQGSAATSGNIVISDVIAAGLDLNVGALPADCSYNSGTRTVTCTITASIAIGGSVNRVLSVTPNTTGSIVNIAYVRGGGDTVCKTGVADGSLPIRCVGDVAVDLNMALLQIKKTASVSPLVRGVPFQYTLTVKNIGTAATTLPTTITDVISPDLTLNVGALPGNCSYNSGTRTVTCTIPAGLAVNATATVNLTATANVDSGNIENSATAFGGGDVDCDDAASAEVTARCHGVVTTPVTAPLLSVAKSASKTGVRVGDTYSYTLTFANTGSAATTATATISDQVPTNLVIGSIVSSNPSVTCAAVGQTVTCSVASGFAAGASASVTIDVTPSVAGTYDNHVATFGGGDGTCVDSTSADATDRCNGDADTVTAYRYPILNVVKTASAPTLRLGQPATYTIHVTNQGPAPLAPTYYPIQVADTLPVGFTIGTLPAGCTATGQAVSCVSNAVLQPNDPSSYVEFVIPFTPTVVGDDVPNTAYASGGGSAVCWTGSTNCSSTALVDVVAPELLLEKAASTANMVVGVPATYTLTVKNQGTAATDANVNVVDIIPAELDVTTATLPSECTYDSGTRALMCVHAAPIAAGGQISYTIDVTPNATVDNLLNRATVRGGDDTICTTLTDPNEFNTTGLPARCVGDSTVDLNAPRLIIDKTESVSTVRQGQATTYSIAVTNDGLAATISPAIIEDVLPAEVTLVASSLPAGCTYDSGARRVSCTIPAGLAVGNTTTFSFDVTDNVGSGSVSNIATVRGGGDLDCVDIASAAQTQHCYDTVSFDAQAPLLNILKFTPVTTATVGQEFTYTIMLENVGNMATDAVTTISDPVPADLTVVSATSADVGVSCTVVGQNVSCTVPAGVAPGQRIFVTVTVQAAVKGSYLNRAYSYGGGDAVCTSFETAAIDSRCNWAAGSIVITPANVPVDPTEPEPANPTTPIVPSAPNTGGFSWYK